MKTPISSPSTEPQVQRFPLAKKPDQPARPKELLGRRSKGFFTKISKGFSALGDMVAPHRCPACQTIRSDPTAGFCLPCRQSIQQDQKTHNMLLSKEKTPLSAGSHPGPRSHWALVSCHASFLYGGQLSVAIHRGKYGGSSHVCHALGAIWRSTLTLSDTQAGIQERTFGPTFLEKSQLAIPVPLHPRRLRQRGFNQTVLLARPLVRSLGLALSCRGLLRIRDTPAQASLSLGQRRTNVQGAFVVHDPRVQGRVILLLDDVMTTGATVGECARVLLEAGAQAVHVLTLARAVP